MDANDVQGCPRCGGTGVDPQQSPKPTPAGVVSADRCRQCGGSGRIPIASKPKPPHRLADPAAARTWRVGRNAVVVGTLLGYSWGVTADALIALGLIKDDGLDHTTSAVVAPGLVALGGTSGSSVSSVHFPPLYNTVTGEEIAVTFQRIGNGIAISRG